MNKKIMRTCTALLSGVLLLASMPMSALAASVGSTASDITAGEDVAQNAKTTYADVNLGDAKTKVYLTIDDSDRVVSVPTTIVLSGVPNAHGEYIGQYSVGVSGDMAGSKTVTVKPDDEIVALHQTGKNDKKAKIAQQQTVFSSADFKNNKMTTGTVTADKLTAGSWNTQTSFTISTEDTSKPIYSAKDGYSSGYISNKTVNASNTFSYTDKIAVKPGQLYSFTYPACTSCLTTYDADGNILRTYLAPQLKSDIGNSYCGNPSDHNDYDYESGYVTIPSNVHYIAFNVKTTLLTNNTFFVFKGDYPLETHSYTSKLSDTNNNLKGKSVIFYGDSICEGIYSARESFAEYVAEANNMKVQNKAVSGTQSDKILAKITEKANDNDYVIVEGFINDCSDLNFTVTPIGELTPSGTTTFDTTTFVGRLENAIYNYQQGNYKAKLAFILTYEDVGMVSSKISVREYWDAAISVFEKYGISYLDLGKKTYPLLDTLHPGFEGQLQMAEDVERWMNTL